MKYLVGAILVGVISFVVPSYAQEDHEYAKDVKERTLRIPTCNKPIGTVAARRFSCKAAACRGGTVYLGPGYTVTLTTEALGDGLADMLVTALANTGCFRVLERAAMQEIKEELELMGVQPKQTLKAADFIITGAVTALETQASGIGGGGVVIPLPFKIGGGLKIGKGSAHIGLDMRLVYVKGGEVIAARTVEGKSERWRFGIAGGGLFGTTIAGGWFEAFKNTPLEEATRDLIAKAVTLIVEDAKRFAPADVSVGEKVVMYDEKGNVVKEEINMPVSKAQREAGEGVVAGSVKRASYSFSHYKNVLLSEDFSGCKVVPTNFQVRGKAECVEMGGKRWVSTTYGQVILERTIPKFDPKANWAIEYKVALSQRVRFPQGAALHIGKQGGPLVVWIKDEGKKVTVNDHTALQENLVGKIVKIGIVKKDNQVDVFVDDKRVYTGILDPVAISKLEPKLIFDLHGEDIEKGIYTLITDITVSQE
ncbi:CsgG/HfaB family protein [Pampinifervens florentissimum]|uniref:CsgG/HfaB family protein n=1 Tax=Pampinifervens florentissimum TaxID=1632019 RepID=UPI0013B4853A|nr:CsgG/HfaB family protein [Hydrogenobacter sp. T-8]QID33379.1 hypothetical protein G3M65_06195 [Hydrogenobacter sp. T-8]